MPSSPRIGPRLILAAALVSWCGLTGCVVYPHAYGHGYGYHGDHARYPDDDDGGYGHYGHAHYEDDTEAEVSEAPYRAPEPPPPPPRRRRRAPEG
jgi:hypothetical protein